MTIGIWEILLLGVVGLLFFGSGKLSRLMGDLGQGIREFRKAARTPEPQSTPPESTSEPTANRADVLPPGAVGADPRRMVDVSPGTTSIKV